MDLPPPEGPSSRSRSPGQRRRLTAAQDRLATVAVAKHQVVRLEHRRRVPGTHSDAAGRQCQGRWRRHLRAGRGVEEGRHLLPGDRRARQMPEARGQFFERLIGQQDAAQADGERRLASRGR